MQVGCLPGIQQQGLEDELVEPETLGLLDRLADGDDRGHEDGERDQRDRMKRPDACRPSRHEPGPS
jgi:hypothetical protein